MIKKIISTVLNYFDIFYSGIRKQLPLLHMVYRERTKSKILNNKKRFKEIMIGNILEPYKQPIKYLVRSEKTNKNLAKIRMPKRRQTLKTVPVQRIIEKDCDDKTKADNEGFFDCQNESNATCEFFDCIDYVNEQEKSKIKNITLKAINHIFCTINPSYILRKYRTWQRKQTYKKPFWLDPVQLKLFNKFGVSDESDDVDSNQNLQEK
ncbi:hypothetical protein EDEG_00773 [Edhazardia aedis USNM 41457]|uniref:Uncharacterized protein n=1 Tax=Edhazardia aedis (strain USNM 41457) TaxID=1003232 RepID=J9DBM7_EDHAE|nr:hypothetical protein EDEG_00773 [Edhazardia aedis USNM 41457]|eukprot:EJW05126.1 hypothetical protein EDEG_00773 [Edhazardia aedis USNM 41457]